MFNLFKSKLSKQPKNISPVTSNPVTSNKDNIKKDSIQGKSPVFFSSFVYEKYNPEEHKGLILR